MAENSLVGEGKSTGTRKKAAFVPPILPESVVDARSSTMGHVPKRFIERGAALIISNIKFDKSCLKQCEERFGGKKDRDDLNKFFRSIKFEVINSDNDSVAKIKKKVDEFVKVAEKGVREVLPLSWCSLVIILTHGEAGGLLMASDGRNYNLKDVWGPLVYSEDLKDTPKIFIFQACRGEEYDKGQVLCRDETEQAMRQTSGRRTDVSDTSADGSAGSSDDEDFIPEPPAHDVVDMPRLTGDAYRSSAPSQPTGEKKTLPAVDVHFPQQPDVLLAFSSADNKKSMRNTDSGTHYVRALLQALREPSHQPLDLVSVLCKTHRILASKVFYPNSSDTLECSQSGMYTSYLNYNLYLHSEKKSKYVKACHLQ